MRVVLIRHSLTLGNVEKRYIGSTDQPLCEAGRQQAQELYASGSLPRIDRLFISPLTRCAETAGILFPRMEATVIRDLRECEFGAFEGKSAEDLQGNAAYQKWLDTGCLEDTPGGEGLLSFQARCRKAFEEALSACAAADTAAFVVHGGTIMAILSAYALPKRAFYEHPIKNCGTVLCDCGPGPALHILERWAPC